MKFCILVTFTLYSKPGGLRTIKWVFLGNMGSQGLNVE